MIPPEQREDAPAQGTEEKTDRKWPKIATYYVTQKKECLISVAHQHGFIDPEHLLDHPENAELKETYSNFASLPEHTVIAVPEKVVTAHRGSLDATGTYFLKLVVNRKRTWFTVKLVSPGPQPRPLAQIEYLLMTREHPEVYKGASDEEGIIDVEIPFDTICCDLIVWPFGRHHVQSVHYVVTMGSTDRKGSPCYERSSLCNAGVGSVDVEKDKPLSGHGAHLLSHTGTIIPAVNFHHDAKTLVDLAMLRRDKLAELEELEKIMDEKEAARQPTIGYHRETFRRFLQLKHIEEQIHLHEIQLETIKEDYTRHVEGRLYGNFLRDVKTNERITDKLIQAVKSEKPMEIDEEIEEILPLDDRYLSLIGGIEALRSGLEKKEQRLKTMDKKLASAKEKNPPLIKARRKLQKSIYLHRVQLDFSEKTGTQEGEAQHAFQASPFESMTTLRHEKEPFITPHSLIPRHSPYPLAVVKRTAYVTRGYRRELHVRPETFGGDIEIKTLTIEDPPLTLFFEYNDEIGGPVRNATVLYWVAEKGEDRFSDALKGLPLMFPVGIGITNGSGMLTKSCSLAELNTLHHLITKTDSEKIDGRVQHIEAVEGNRAALNVEMLETEVVMEQGEGITPPTVHAANTLRCHMPELYREWTFVEKYKKRPKIPEAYKKMSLTHFNPGLRFGFFVYPAYKGAFETQSLFDLARLKTPGGVPAALLGTLEELNRDPGTSQATLPVFCPLPQWEQRILAPLNRLESLLNEYECAKAPHMQKLSLLNTMQTLVQTNIDFPFYKQSDHNITAKKTLLDHLEGLEEGIFRGLSEPNPNDTQNPIPDILEDIHETAGRLVHMLESKEFLDEWRRWFKHILTLSGEELEAWYAKPEANLLPPGPYMQDENDWGTIFDTLARAYTALARTTWRDHVAKEDILKGLERVEADKSMLDYIKVGEEEVVQFKNHTKFIPQEDCRNDAGLYEDSYIAKDNKAPIDDFTSLFGVIVKGFMDTTEYIGKKTSIFIKFNSLLSISPGPPSLLQVVASTYANHLTAGIAKAADLDSNPTALIRLMTLVRAMGFFGGKNTKQFESTKAVLYTLLYERDARGAGANGGRLLHKIFYPGIDLTDEHFNARAHIEEYNRTHHNASRVYRTVFAFLGVCTMVTDLRHQAGEENDGDQAPVVTALDTLHTWGSAVYTGHTVYLLKDMWKAGNPRVSGAVATSAERIASTLNGIFAVVSFYEAGRMIEAGEVSDDKLAFLRHTAAGIGSGSVAMGQVFQKFGKKQVFKLVNRQLLKFVAREATLQCAHVVPLIGQGLVLIGTYINAVLLACDITQLMFEFFKAPVRNTVFGPVGMELLGLWDKVRDKPAVTTHQVPDGYDLHKRHLTADVFTHYKKDATLKESIRKIGTLLATIEKNYDLDSNGPLFDPGAVWSHVSWHAVIPLYNAGFDTELIEKLAAVPRAIFTTEEEKRRDEWNRAFYSCDAAVDSVEDIVDYYTHCNNPTAQYFEDQEDRKNRDNPDWKPLKAREIVPLMDKGAFLPQAFIKQGYHFYQSQRWDLDHFSKPATERGILDLGKQIQITTALQHASDWQTFRKTPLMMKTLVAVFYVLPREKLRQIKYSHTYVDDYTHIDEKKLAKLLKEVGRKPQRYPVPPGTIGHAPETVPAGNL